MAIKSGARQGRVCVRALARWILKQPGGNTVDDAIMATFGIKHRLTTTYHPQAIGLDERFNQCLGNTIAKFAQEERCSWDESCLKLCIATTQLYKSPHVTLLSLKPCLEDEQNCQWISTLKKSLIQN